MAEKLNTDQFGRLIVDQQMICDQLFVNPAFDYSNIQLVDAEEYNRSIDSMYLDWKKLESIETVDISPAEWHEKNQKIWLMPDEYKNLDIVKWLLDRCKDETELQRTAMEILLYSERDLLDLLRYLKYLVDTMRSNKIVWGVGRGSSVASFVLYLIGVHRINSITYNLDISEFIR